MMRTDHISAALLLVVVTLLFAIIFGGTAIIKRAHGEDKLLCHLEPGGDGWHYRTQIPPLREAKCWYEGPRMLSRDRLYWAEAPSIPQPIPNLIWQQEHRWRWSDPAGWTHQE